MSTRYDDRDNERGQRNYGRRSSGEYDRSYNQSSQSGYGRGFEDERDRYSSESRWRGQYGGGRSPYRSGGEYRSSREDYGDEGWESNYAGERITPFGTGRALGADYGLGYSGSQSGYGSGESDYGSSGLGYGGAERGYRDYRRGSGGRGEGRYGDTSRNYSERYNYPTGFRSGERYSERGRGYDAGREYGRGEYGRGEYGGDYGRGEYGGEERGWWDRASDEVASWFGDEEAERRRRLDAQRPHRGKGPKSYRRSDERIQEDINDRLSEGYIDATDITVSVQNAEVTLTGTVNSRADKRRAEDIAEYVSGVSNVENRLRVKNADAGRYGSLQNTGLTDTSSTMGTGATGTSATGTGTSSSTGTSARGRSAGS